MDTRCLTLEPATAPGPPRYSTSFITFLKWTRGFQGRSAGDEEDQRPNHRFPRPHHRSRARRDFGDQGDWARSETKCWCWCEESQGKNCLSINLTTWLTLFLFRATVKLGRRSSITTYMRTTLVARYVTLIGHHLRRHEFFRWGAFSQGTCTSTRKLNRLSMCRAES